MWAYLKTNSVHFRTLFSSVVQVSMLLGSKLPFQVPFQVHKKSTLFLHLQYAVVIADGLGRSLNISNPLEMPLEMLCEFESL